MGKYAFIMPCGFLISGFVFENWDTFRIRIVLIGHILNSKCPNQTRRVPIFRHESAQTVSDSPDSGHVEPGGRICFHRLYQFKWIYKTSSSPKMIRVQGNHKCIIFRVHVYSFIVTRNLDDC